MSLSLKRVDKVKLEDKTTYTGDAYLDKGRYVPHGYGRKDFDGYYGIGHFEHGVLQGPVYVNHGHYMYTSMMQCGKPFGWSLRISGGLPFFNVLINGEEKEDLSELIRWYFDYMKKHQLEGRLFHYYPTAGEIFIGYPSDPPQVELGRPFCGLHFMNDGDVWLGNTDSLTKTGVLIHFCKDGHIEPGMYEKGELIIPMTIQDVINSYWGYIDANGDRLLEGLMEEDESIKAVSVENSPYKNIKLDTNRNYYQD